MLQDCLPSLAMMNIKSHLAPSWTQTSLCHILPKANTNWTCTAYRLSVPAVRDSGQRLHWKYLINSAIHLHSHPLAKHIAFVISYLFIIL